MTDTEPPVKCVAGKYVLHDQLGSGSFGQVWHGQHRDTGAEVAVKLEPCSAQQPQLLYEARVLRLLSGGVGVPSVQCHGSTDAWHFLTMERLGPSLEDLFTFCRRKFTLKTVLMAADQMLSRLEYIHYKNFIHRDVKPDNFLVGVGAGTNQISCIDFGLAKRYRGASNMQHIAYRDDKHLTGTARYASMNTHLGIEQSRRDDLESLGYVLLYFLRGSLPWQNLRAPNRKQKYEKICFAKLSLTVDQLCSGLPPEFATYLTYVRGLSFDESPDYCYLRRLLRDLFVAEGLVWDFMFDWAVLRAQQQVMGRGVPRLPPTHAHVSSESPATTTELINARQIDTVPLQSRDGGFWGRRKPIPFFSRTRATALPKDSAAA